MDIDEFQTQYGPARRYAMPNAATTQENLDAVDERLIWTEVRRDQGRRLLNGRWPEHATAYRIAATPWDVRHPRGAIEIAL
jgi:hypothetical protein